MISIPSCYDVICRMTYRKQSVIQRLNLSKFDEIKSRFLGARLDLLVYRPNKVYGWAQLDNVSVQNTISCCYYSTNIRGMHLLVPYKFKYSFVSLPPDFFQEKILTPQEYAFGLEVLDCNFEIKSPFKTLGGIPYGSYVTNAKELNKYKIKWFINQRRYDYRYYCNNISSILYDYIKEYYENRIDVYLTHVLLKSRILVPLIWNASRIEVEGKLTVPMENSWIFQLLYGRDTDVVFLDKYDQEVSYRDLHTKHIQRFIKVPELMLDMRGLKCTPVLVHRNFAMRFKHV